MFTSHTVMSTALSKWDSDISVEFFNFYFFLFIFFAFAAPQA